MKTSERNRAIEMRKQGFSMGKIASELKVAKSSVSNWVREIKLTTQQRKQLTANGFSVSAVEKRREARLANTKRKRAELMDTAIKEIPELSKDPLWCIGVALYWGEGGKTQQTARIANSDPGIVVTAMRFFKKYSGLPKNKYRAHIHTFSEQNSATALAYWSRVTGIPKNAFYRTYVKKSIASRNKRTTLPYGTIQIYLHDTKFFFRLMGWIKGIQNFS